MKSISLDKQQQKISRNNGGFCRRSHTFYLVLVMTLCIQGFDAEARKKYDKEGFFKLEAKVNALLNSPVADAAPLEIKFIKEKMVLAKNAKADKKKKLEMQLTEQIEAEIEIAKLRSELNQLNADLLNKRDQLSAGQVYLLDLKEQLK